jgi:hypothetical protein
MRMHPTRKCSRFADVRKFADSEYPKSNFGPSNRSFEASYNSFKHTNFGFSHCLALIQAHGDWL